jgi:hypothetical protein
MVVRTVVLETGAAYAVSLRVDGGPIDDTLYQLYSLACRSVEFKAAFRRG